jgi:hypothetical protein
VRVYGGGGKNLQPSPRPCHAFLLWATKSTGTHAFARHLGKCLYLLRDARRGVGAQGDFLAEFGPVVPLSAEGSLPLGFCFSFPMTQTSLQTGTLLAWTKVRPGESDRESRTRNTHHTSKPRRVRPSHASSCRIGCSATCALVPFAYGWWLALRPPSCGPSQWNLHPERHIFFLRRCWGRGTVGVPKHHRCGIGYRGSAIHRAPQ